MKLRRDVVDSMIRHDPELLSGIISGNPPDRGGFTIRAVEACKALGVWDAIVSDAVRQLVVLNVERWIHGEPPKRLSEVL